MSKVHNVSKIMYMSTVVDDNGNRTSAIHSKYDNACEYLKDEYDLDDESIMTINDCGSFEEESGYVFSIEEIDYFG